MIKRLRSYQYTYSWKDYKKFPIVNGVRLCPGGNYSWVEPACSNSWFGAGSIFGNELSFGSNNLFGPACRFGAQCKFGSECQFGPNCSFGPDCRVGSNCSFGPNNVFEAYTQFGVKDQFSSCCQFDVNLVFGPYSEFGSGCFFKGYIKIGLCSVFGADCEFGRRVEFGERCRFGPSCKFGDDCSFEGELAKHGSHFIVVDGIGPDEASPCAFDLQNGIKVRAGGFVGTLSEFRSQIREEFSDNDRREAYLSWSDIVERLFARP